MFCSGMGGNVRCRKAARDPHGRAAVVRRRRSLTNGDSGDKATCIHNWIARAFGGQGYCYFTTERKTGLCCRTVLMALRVMCAFATAWAATFVAAKAARVPHGRKATCIHGWLACAFVRLRRPKAPLRETWLPLLAPLHAALPCGGGSSLHSSLRSRLRRSRLCSTRFHNTAA